MKNSRSIFIFIILIVGLLTYGNGFFNGFVNDDFPQIIDNAAIHSTQYLPKLFTTNIFYDGSPLLGPAYYKPLMYTSFAFIYSIFGHSAPPFHIFQILLFITNAVLLFLVLLHFFKKPTAFALSLIFLVHPFTSEVAFYISDLQDVLYFFFGIIAFLILQKCDSKKAFILSELCLFLSLLSKETGLLFLLISLAYIFAYKRKYFIFFLITTIAIGAMYLFLRLHAIGLYTPYLISAPIETLTFSQRLITMPMIFFFYVKNFFIPLDLSVSHLWVVRSIDFSHFFLPLLIDILFLAIVVYGAIWLRRQKNIFSLYLFFAVWFLLGIVFHLQIITLDKTVADRWFYFSIVGMLGMLGIVAEAAKINWKSKWLIFGISVIILLFVSRTIVRSFDWRSDLILSTHDIKVSPEAYDLETELCYDYFVLQRYDLVKIHAERSIKLFPFVVNYTDLGVAYFFMHDYANAKKYYLDATKIGDYEQTYVDLSAVALYYGNPKENISFIKNVSLKKFPHTAQLWVNLALIEYNYGNKDEAKKEIKEAYSLNHDSTVSFFYYRIMNNLPEPLHLKNE